MTVQDIFEFLNKNFPVNTACDFDNVGILVGERQVKVTSAVVALDCTQSVIDLAVKKGANLIITHHPVIFDPLKIITTDDIPAVCIKLGISVISMHTNLDVGKGGVNDALCKALHLKKIKSVSAKDGYLLRVGENDTTEDADKFAGDISRLLNTPVRYVAGSRAVKTVMVCSGSGGNYLDDAVALGADAFVTADVKHNVFLLAEQKDITLIDAGHFATEDVVVEPLAQMLKGEFGGIEFFTEHSFGVKYISGI